jgi:hypothetical protein
MSTAVKVTWLVIGVLVLLVTVYLASSQLQGG